MALEACLPETSSFVLRLEVLREGHIMDGPSKNNNIHIMEFKTKKNNKREILCKQKSLF